MPKPKIEFDALGTHWWIEVLDTDDDTDIAKQVMVLVMTFQSDYSRFDPDSYIGRLNANKVLPFPPNELVEMMTYAHTMSTHSYGIFNISVGGTLGKLGYGTAEETAAVHQSIWDCLSYSHDMITLPKNTEIDLGGFGKGWLIDKIADFLRSSGRRYFVINGGGDIRVSSNQPIELALEHPLTAGQMIGTTKITTGALAVSSTKKRVWKQGARTHHHIIDPRTDMPSESDIVATYIKAETALVADTMATILLIAPELEQELTKRFSLQSILVNKSAL